MRLFTLAVSLFCLAGFAQANNDIETYRYGTKLDISKVISVKTADTKNCEPVTAVMTYEDSNGNVRKMAYSVLSDMCNNEN